MTTSVLNAAKYVALGLCLCAGAAAHTQAPADPAVDHWNRIVELNTLTESEKIPFYLKIEFQIFDLKGKPGETGTAEVWWSKQRRYEVIASPSWNETSAPGEPHQPQTRQSYLIWALIEQAMDPMQKAKLSPASKVVEADRNFGSTLLRCLTSTNQASPDPTPITICVDPGADALRVVSEASATDLRNRMGKFRDTYVGLDLTTTYGVSKAITGKVVALKSIPADDEHIKPLPEPAATAATPETRPRTGVHAGRKLEGENPQYPYSARQSHIAGTVVIKAIISKEGKITSTVVIASPDASLTEAALDAVRTWKYEPYLLNGQPTDVDTVIYVNFNLGS